MKIVSKSVAGVIAACALTAPAHATIRIDIMEISGSQMSGKTLFLDPVRYRVQTGGNDQNGIVTFRYDTLFLLNYKDGTFTVLNKEKMARKAEAHKKNLEQYSLKDPEVKREVRMTERIGGAASQICRFWEIRVDGKLQQDVCFIPLKAMNHGKMILEIMRKHNELMASLPGAVSDMNWSDVETTRGYPLIVRNFDDKGRLHSQSTVMRIDATLPSIGDLLYLPVSGMKEEQNF